MYRTLDPVKIVATVTALERRIGERFPDSGLRRVAQELIELTRLAKARTDLLTRPNLVVRAATWLVVVLGLAILAAVVLRFKIEAPSTELFGMMQGIDAAVNLTIVIGAAVLFLVTLEGRLKRTQALRHLHEIRALVHVIDMHQLTKDPSALISGGPATAHSPVRTMTPFELTRYLDYSSEMLSLAAKVAALYAQSATDPLVIDAVTDIERLTSNLSLKIWQKITLVQTAQPGVPGAALHAAASAITPG